MLARNSNNILLFNLFNNAELNIHSYDILQLCFPPYPSTCQFVCASFTSSENIVRGHPGRRRGRSYLPKLSHFSLFQAQGEVVLHRKNTPKGYHFSSKLPKMVKTSSCFKFVELPLKVQTNYKITLPLFDQQIQAEVWVLSTLPDYHYLILYYCQGSLKGQLDCAADQIVCMILNTNNKNY